MKQELELTVDEDTFEYLYKYREEIKKAGLTTIEDIIAFVKKLDKNVEVKVGTNEA